MSAPEDNPADDRFVCPYCAADYDSADDLTEHVHDQHPRKRDRDAEDDYR